MNDVIRITRTIPNLILFSIASFLFITSGILSAQAGQNISKATFNHPGWVQIPGHLIRPDCVHEIPKGAKVEIGNDSKTTGDVTLNGVFVAHYDACPETPIVTRHQGRTEGLPVPSANGWVEASQVDLSQLLQQRSYICHVKPVIYCLQPFSSNNIDFMGGFWTVPSNPSMDGGVIYLFNGIETSGGGWILQPVLQYYGGSWAIASWLVSSDGYAFHGPLEIVNPGDVLYGYTKLTAASAPSAAASTLDWKVQVSDQSTGAYSWITVSTLWPLHWTQAYAGVLEAYNITSCSQFPSKGNDVFHYNQVAYGFPSYNSIYWAGWYGAVYSYGGPSCGFGVAVGNAYPNTSVLYY